MTMRNEPPNLFYRGSSMKGTFKPGDRLYIEKIPYCKIRKGDLIIFHKTINDKTEFVVHRVIRKNIHGIITRGDNCRHNDRGLVIEDNIIGRVKSYNRYGKLIFAINGFSGRFHALCLHIRLKFISILKKIMSRPYRFLKKTRIVARIWHPEIKAILFHNLNGSLIKFVHRNNTVIIYWTEQNKWIYRRPYDLIMQPHTKRQSF